MGLALCILASCATTDRSGQRPTESAPPAKLTLKLAAASVGTRDLAATASHFERSLGFQLETVRDGKLMTARFADGSELRFLATGGSGHSNSEFHDFLEEREGAWLITIRANHRGLLNEKMGSIRDIRIEEDTRAGAERGSFRVASGSALGFLSFAPPVSGSMATAQATLHPNTAAGLGEIWIVVDSLSEIEDESRRLQIGSIRETILQPLRAKAIELLLDDGKLVFVQRDHLEPEALAHLGERNPQITGVSVDAANIESTTRLFKKGGVRHAIARYNGKSCLILAPKNAGGLFLELVRTGSRP